ncbi:MAG: hypothetical protein K6E51_09790, partial [Treponema sp.]|nr:hypothetical protein [Treponema sp.]
RLWDEWLLTCDSNKVISIDIRTGATFENAHTGNAPSRLTSAVPDVNGNVLVTDMVSNEMYIMSKMSEVIGGLFVQIEQVNADAFPEVTLKLRVENRHRQSVVGLLENNFYLSENNRPVSDMKLVGAANNNAVADVTLIIDRSPETQMQNDSLEAAVREIAESMHHAGTLRIVSSGKVPVTEYEGSPDGALRFATNALRNPVTTAGSLDLAVRLAANDLVKGEEKRAIVYLTAGSISQNAFTMYALSDLAAYLNNNSIIFDVIQLTQQSPADELSYLSSHTRGENYFVYRPEGLLTVVQDVINQPSGLYQLTYRSSLPTNFGQAYLPLEAEVYLMNRSGRDETGYFAPLQ